MRETIKIKGLSLHYVDEGKGDTLLFLHGWPTNSQLWSEQIKHFRQEFRVIALDWPGFGNSAKPLNQLYSFTFFKQILNAFIEKLELTKLTIIAHDIGGPPAILYTWENQNNVHQLILLNTIIYPFTTPFDRISRVLFKTPGIRNLLMSKEGLPLLMKVNTRNRSLQAWTSIKEILIPYQNLTSKLKIKTIHDPLEYGEKNELQNLSNQFAEISSKKSLIIARKDPLCYAHIQKLHKENPVVQAFTLKNSGHYIPLDEPEKLNKILAEIIGQ